MGVREEAQQPIDDSWEDMAERSIPKDGDAPDRNTTLEEAEYAKEAAKERRKSRPAGIRADVAEEKIDALQVELRKGLRARIGELTEQVKKLEADRNGVQEIMRKMAQLDQAYSGSVEFFWTSSILNGIGGVFMGFSGGISKTEYPTAQPFLLCGGGALLLIGLFIGCRNAAVNRPRYFSK